MKIYDIHQQLPDELSRISEDQFQLQVREHSFDEIGKSSSAGFYRDALRRLRQNKASVVSFWIILSIIILAVIVPGVTGYTYTQQNVSGKNLPPKIPVLEKIGIADGTMVLTNRKKDSLSNPKRFPEGSVLSIVREYKANKVDVVDVKVDYYKYCGISENEYHWFGTDYLGRDILTRLFMGARVSLLIAFISVITNVVIGVIYGSIAGYYGGKVDMFLTHFAEVLDGLPYIVVTILFMLLFGSGMFSIILALTVTGWIGTARLTRAQFYRFKGREYVLAARTLGVPDRKLIFRHILPNSIGPLITRAMIAIPGAIFSESFLAYIGLGIKPPEPSIGTLLSVGQSVLLQYPYQTLFPAVLISLLMVAFNLFSNGLRDAMDPTLRGEEG
ncbi:MAG: ABC transporter permease [Clostridiales bacterium]|nr:ABC transporter permease [Clostridiales bacterium]